MNKMKRLTHISLFAALCVSLVASCTKSEDGGTPFNPDKVRVMLNFGTEPLGVRAASTTQHGEKIEDVMVWAYATDASGAVADTLTSWAAKNFSDTYTTTEGQSLYMELPKLAADATYRFVAVVNQSKFENIYKHGGTEPLTLNEKTRYTDLIKARFYAPTFIENKLTALADEAMPVSHWKDVEIAANATEVDLDMTVYRAVANLTFNAALKAEDVGQAVVRIDQVTLTSQGEAHTEGFLFSDHEQITSATALPSAFGIHSDLGHAALSHVFSTGAKLLNTADMSFVGETLLYENHVGADAASASYTSSAGYPSHCFYLKVDYSFAKGADIGTDTQTSACYMPLPAIVRNHNVNVKATFDVTMEGKVYLQYVVVDWKDGGQMDIDFAYPTYNAFSAVKNGEGNEVYAKPTASYHETSGKADNTNAFVFKFQMTSPAGQIWAISKQGSNPHDFIVEVYDASDVLQTESDGLGGEQNRLGGFVASDEIYTIKVYPKTALGSAASRSIDVGITYTPSWTGQTERLLINASSGNATKWPDSGGNQHFIRVTQLASGS